MKGLGKLGLSLLGALALVSLQSGCGQTTTRGLKGADLSKGGLVQGGTSGGNPAHTTNLGFSPYGLRGNGNALLGIKSLTICVDSATFIPESGNAQVVELEDLGQIQVLSTGTPLKSIEIPEGRYRSVILELDDECGKMQSVQLVNALGTFRTDEEIELVFSGNIVLRREGQELWLDLTTVVLELLNVGSSDQLDDAMRAVEGRLEQGTRRNVNR